MVVGCIRVECEKRCVYDGCIFLGMRGRMKRRRKGVCK